LLFGDRLYLIERSSQGMASVRWLRI